MALPNLDNVGLTTTINSYTSADWTNFANDMAVNFVGAWASRYTLTPRQMNALGNVPPSEQQQFVNSANYASSVLAAGNRLDAIGEAFDKNPVGGPTPSISIKVEVNASYDPNTGTVTGSISISITFGFSL